MEINTISDIALAIEYLEAEPEGRKNAKEKTACTLICEELLLLLLRRECTGICIYRRGRLRPYFEIRAKGRMIEFDDPLLPEEAIDPKIQIAGKILENYADHIRYKYRNGENFYRIYAHIFYNPDLSGEIFDFYNSSIPGEKRNGFSILGHIVRRHPVQIGTAVLYKTVKHLAALMLSVFTSSFIDALTGAGSFFSSGALKYVFASFAALFINLFFFGVDAVFYHRFTRAVESGFKLAIVQKLQTLSMRYHNSAQSGKLLSKLVSDVQFIQILIYTHFEAVLHLSVDIVFLIVMALIKFPPMLLLYMVIVPASVLIANSFSKTFMGRRKQMRKKIEQSNAAFKEMLDMKEITRAHGLQKLEYRDITEKVKRAQRASTRYDLLSINVNNVTFGGYNAFRLVCLCVAGILFTKGYISVGTLVLFQSLFEMIINSLQKVIDAMPDIIQGCDSLISVDEILSEQDTEKNGSLPPARPVRGEIVLEDVVFSYDGEEGTPVLNGVSLQIPPCSSVAFIGDSGQGKTTMFNLMLGMYEKQSGKILIDGIDIDDLDKNEYRKLVAVVPQAPVLFDGTLWDNLTYGIPFITEERVQEVLTEVGLWEMIENLPNGLAATVYEGGVNFSGGQRQRIAIARALLRDARIIFFDEATSALDAESEAQVQKAVDSIMRKCTVVMIAHRLNTLKNADRIYRIGNGTATPAEI